MFNELVLVLLAVLFIVREYFHSQEVSRLLEMLKKPETKSEPQQANQIVEEENQISIDDPEFDIKKINKVITNGQEIPITIQ